VKRFYKTFRNLVRDEEGAALIEYALLLCLIAVVCVFFISSFGPKVSNKYSEAAAAG
jgi:Flp pilus assembly pilin Flp